MNRAMMVAAAALVAAPAVAHAQYDRTQVDFGVKGGVVFGNINNEGVLPGDLETSTGFTAGLAASTQWEVLGVGLEALYARRGFNLPGGTTERRFDFIDVPAYLRATVPFRGVQPFAYAGPQVSFEVNCVAEEAGVDDADCAGDRPTTSFAAVIGAGLRFGERNAFSIEGRYAYGLTDLEFETVTDGDEYRNRTFLILAGIQF